MSANTLAPLQGQLAAPFANMDASVNDELSAGIEMGFAILGFKGKVWSIRHRGEERTLMRPDGDGPRNSIEAVILRASSAKSKIWYEHGYVEGSTEAPDCFSTNGVTPDPGSKKPQSQVCATCPMNQWGSRMTPAGKKGKACSDAKRVAIAPLQDIPNELYGGPMLLRVPAASLQGLATYADQLKGMGFQYFAVGTRIAFDPAEAYPKFQFSPIRLLTADEAQQVIALRDSPQVTRILAEGDGGTVFQPQIAGPAPIQFEQPPSQFTQQPVVQQPVVQQPANGGFGVTAPAATPPAQAQTLVPPVNNPPQQASVTPQVTTAPAQTEAPTTGAEVDFDKKLDALLG